MSSWSALPLSSSWPGFAVRWTASRPLAYVPAIHVLVAVKTWMPRNHSAKTRFCPGMTNICVTIAVRLATYDAIGYFVVRKLSPWTDPIRQPGQI
jgi:predicted Kef-type K+ transport protein